jgi:hypothetical protein
MATNVEFGTVLSEFDEFMSFFGSCNVGETPMDPPMDPP